MRVIFCNVGYLIATAVSIVPVTFINMSLDWGPN